MKNNKAYLEKLPLILLLFVVAAILQEFVFTGSVRSAGEQPGKLIQLADQITFNSTIFVALGLAFDKWKQAIIAIAVATLIGLVNIYFFNDLIAEKRTSNAIMMYIAVQLLYTFVYVAFFVNAELTGTRLARVIMSSFVFMGATALFYFQSLLGDVDDKFSTHIAEHRKFTGTVILVFYNMLRFLFFSEVQNLADGKAAGWKTFLLNPGNSINKVNATLVFFFTKLIMYTFIIGLSYVFTSFSHRWGNNDDPITSYFFYTLLLNGLLGLQVLLFCSWYLRKFLLEYFIEYSISSKVLYWLMLMPGIGFIVWLIVLSNDKVNTVHEKVDQIHAFAAADSKGISITYFVILFLQFIIAMASGAVPAALISVIISAILFIWFINHKSGYYVNFYLTLTVMLSILGWVILQNDRGGNLPEFLYIIFLFSLSQLVLIFPVFHFDNFIYIVPEENEVQQHTDENDLLPGFA